MESGVATAQLPIGKNTKTIIERMGSDNKMIRLLTNRAEQSKTHYFAEADQIDVFKSSSNCS